MELDTEHSKDGESFWTSYSDLFAGLSVIFLVMFFFSTIRLGVEQLKHKNERRNTEEFLKGKVPEAAVQKQIKQTQIVENSLIEIKKQEENLKETASKVSNLITNLENNKQVFKNIIEEQKIKEAALNVSYERNKTIENRNAELEILNKKLDANFKHQELKEKELMAKLDILSTQNSELNSKYQQIEKEKINSSILSKQNEQMILSLQDKVNTYEMQARDEKERFQKANEQIRNQLMSKEQELVGYSSQLRSLSMELEGYKSREKNLEHELMNTRLGGAQSEKMTQKLVGELRQQLDAKNTEIQGLKGALLAQTNGQGSGRGLASDGLGDISTRKLIANGMKNKFASSGIDADVNLESGVLTLSLDEMIHFKSDSFELTDAAKKKLTKLIPIYAEQLFGKQEYSNRIENVVITGHASPWHRSRYLDPDKTDDKAFSYNLRLSKMRAEKVSQFILGNEIGEYQFKTLLQNKTKVQGMGYTNPIKPTRGLAAVEACGAYDCMKSRRVEISFLLNEEKRTTKNDTSSGF